jgi:hypothetical protein
MNKAAIKLIHQLAKKPKMLFLLDSLGALLTAVLLLVILQNFSPSIGMPKTALTLLLSAAVCLFFYSAACFLLLKEKWGVFIRIISAANALYCLMTLLLLIVHYKQITYLGLAYFLGETAIILGLVCIELKTAAKNLNRHA